MTVLSFFIYSLCFANWIAFKVSAEGFCEPCVHTSSCPQYGNLSRKDQQKWVELYSCQSNQNGGSNAPSGFANVAKGDFVCCPAFNTWENVNQNPFTNPPQQLETNGQPTTESEVSSDAGDVAYDSSRVFYPKQYPWYDPYANGQGKRGRGKNGNQNVFGGRNVGGSNVGGLNVGGSNGGVTNLGGQCQALTSFPPTPESGCCGQVASVSDRISAPDTSPHTWQARPRPPLSNSQNRWIPPTGNPQNLWGTSNRYPQNQWQPSVNLHNQWMPSTANPQNQWAPSTANPQNLWGTQSARPQNLWTPPDSRPLTSQNPFGLPSWLSQPFGGFPNTFGRRAKRADNDTVTVSIDNRITGGIATDLEEYPWTALLRTTFDYGYKKSSFDCGGSVISARYILTAAHCVFESGAQVSDVEIFLSEYDKRSFPTDCKINRDGERKCIQNIVMHYETTITHPQYDDTRLQNDIALVKLRGTAPYTEYIRPICLPPINIDSPEYSNLSLEVAGWGRNGTSSSHVKQSTVVHLVAQADCKRHYPHLTPRHLCAAGYSGEDTCKGDSGGPLMMIYQGKYYVSGIVSGKRADSPCGTSVPSLYTNVHHYLDWISSNIRN